MPLLFDVVFCLCAGQIVVGWPFHPSSVYIVITWQT